MIIYFSRNDSVTFLENCLKSLKNARAYGHSKYRTEIILVDDSCSERGHSAVLRFYKESLADYILSRTGCGFPLGCSMALSLAHGSFTVFLDSQAYVSADWLDHLIDPLKRHHALKGTTAKVLQPDGVINSAGCLFDTVSGLPYGALHELPAGSAAAGRITMMPSVSSSCSAFRTSDIIARKGLYCIYASGIAIPDLCLQLGGGRACFAFIPSSSVVCPADAHPLLPDDFEFFAERWSGHIIFGEQEYFARRKLCGSMKSGEAAYSVPFNKEPNTDRAGCPAGCSVPACDFSGTGCGIRLSSEQQSVIRRIKSFSKLIVIKDPAPGRPFYQKYEWGDYYYARSLARAFGRLGFDTRIDSREDWYTNDDGACINIVLRGCVRFYCGRYPKSLNVMWLISHPDMTDDVELNEYDFILAASEILTGKYRGSQSVRVPCAFLPQCTDPEIFSPAPPSEACSSGNLLLGNSRGVLRDTVKKCLDEGVSLEIIGNGWDKLVKPEFVRSGAVPSFLVPFFYRSAETVLNDHWEDMRQNGIVSNRIYDVLACGRGIVTDNYRSIPDELKFACFSYEDCGIRDAIEKCRQFNKSITDEQKLKLYGTISDRHSFSRRALQIIEALYPILKDGRWKNRQESVTSEK